MERNGLVTRIVRRVLPPKLEYELPGINISLEAAAYKGVSGMGPLYTPFDEVIDSSDVITLHCPLTESTRNMIDQSEFERMHRKPLLINTARGGLVNEAALAVALIEGRISGAGFDVITSEPLPADHSFRRLLALPNFILTPHVAWASDEAVQTLTDQVIDNVEAFVVGNARNIVGNAASRGG
jgi:glycerate dehydrogenase